MALSLKKQRWHIKRWFFRLSKLQRSLLIALPMIFVILMVGTTVVLARKDKNPPQNSDVLHAQNENASQSQSSQQYNQPATDTSSQTISNNQGVQTRSQNNQNSTTTSSQEQNNEQPLDFEINLSTGSTSFTKAVTSNLITASTSTGIGVQWSFNDPSGNVVATQITQNGGSVTFKIAANPSAQAGTYPLSILASAQTSQGQKQAVATITVTVQEENFDFSFGGSIMNQNTVEVRINITHTPGVSNFRISGTDLNKCGLNGGSGSVQNDVGVINFTFDPNNPPQNCAIEVKVVGNEVAKYKEFTFSF